MKMQHLEAHLKAFAASIDGEYYAQETGSIGGDKKDIGFRVSTGLGLIKFRFRRRRAYALGGEWLYTLKVGVIFPVKQLIRFKIKRRSFLAKIFYKTRIHILSDNILFEQKLKQQSELLHLFEATRIGWIKTIDVDAETQMLFTYNNPWNRDLTTLPQLLVLFEKLLQLLQDIDGKET